MDNCLHSAEHRRELGTSSVELLRVSGSVYVYVYVCVSECVCVWLHMAVDFATSYTSYATSERKHTFLL